MTFTTQTDPQDGAIWLESIISPKHPHLSYGIDNSDGTYQAYIFTGHKDTIIGDYNTMNHATRACELHLEQLRNTISDCLELQPNTNEQGE